MNSENNFNSFVRLISVGSMSCLVALSLGVTQNFSAYAADSKAVKQKVEKSAPEKTESSDKADKDKSDKSDKTDKAKKDDDKTKETAKTPEPVIENVVNCTADDLVEKPHEYLGKNVRFTSPFFAFSNLALDYKPAFRSSKTHISILVSKAKKKVPLSELKLAMMSPKEKDPETQLLATLKEGDSLEITGKVFSTALDDPWVEILKVKKLGGSTDDKKADASGKAKGNDTKAATDGKNDKANGAKTDSDKK